MSQPVHEGKFADLIIRNGRITTMNPGQPEATAVAIAEGVVSIVGDEREVMQHAGPGTRVVDALGRRVVPGLNDSHLHVIRGGNHFGAELRWDGVSSIAEGMAMIRAQAERTPDGQWVRVIGGWTAAQFIENRMPTLAELNAAAPDTPVMVLHLYQSALLNHAALRAAGITADSPDPDGAQIVRDYQGHPTGMLLAAPQAGILYGTIAKAPGLGAEQRLNGTRHFLAELNRFGLTSAIDAAGGFQSFPDDYDAVRELARRGELTVRIAYNLMPQRPGHEVEDMTTWTQTATPGDGDEFLRLNGAGEILVWSGNDLELFVEPRVVPPASVDAELEKALRVLLGAGWNFRLHSTYDETMRRYLTVIERVAADGLLDNARWFFDHAETASRGDARSRGCARWRHRHPGPHGVPGAGLHQPVRERPRRSRSADRGHAGGGSACRSRYGCDTCVFLQPLGCSRVARHRKNRGRCLRTAHRTSYSLVSRPCVFTPSVSSWFSREDGVKGTAGAGSVCRPCDPRP